MSLAKDEPCERHSIEPVPSCNACGWERNIAEETAAELERERVARIRERATAIYAAGIGHEDSFGIYSFKDPSDRGLCVTIWGNAYAHAAAGELADARHFAKPQEPQA